MIILVLNQGLKSTRCIAFDFDGNCLAESSKPIDTIIFDDFIEQDPNIWKKLAYCVIKDVITKLGKKKSEIKYITVTTSASCMVPVDKNNNALRNCILVSDKRSKKEVAFIQNLDEFKTTSLETGMKSSPDLMIPKILWVKNNENEIFEKTSHFLNAGDYLNMILTGNHVTDVNNALKFFYSNENKSYPVELLDRIGIDINTLPEIKEIGSGIGYITKSISEDLGIPRSCEVILSTYDALAAVNGTGCYETGDSVDVSGTVTSFRVVSSKKISDPLHRIYVSPYTENNKWLVGGSNNLGGGVIEWLKNFNYSNSKDPYTQIEKDGLNHDPCPNGAIFLPQLLGERSPLWNSDCRGVFFGINRTHTREQFTRSVLEGVAFSVRNIGEVVKSFDIDISSVTVSGGLARLDLVNQIKSDVFGLPVKKLSNFETTSIGAALICLVSRGVFSTMKEGFDKFVNIEKIFEPNLINHQIYNDFYQLYEEVYKSLLEPYKIRASLMKKTYKNKSNRDYFKGNL